MSKLFDPLLDPDDYHIKVMADPEAEDLLDLRDDIQRRPVFTAQEIEAALTLRANSITPLGATPVTERHAHRAVKRTLRQVIKGLCGKPDSTIGEEVGEAIRQKVTSIPAEILSHTAGKAATVLGSIVLAAATAAWIDPNEESKPAPALTAEFNQEIKDHIESVISSAIAQHIPRTALAGPAVTLNQTHGKLSAQELDKLLTQDGQGMSLAEGQRLLRDLMQGAEIQRKPHLQLNLENFTPDQPQAQKPSDDQPNMSRVAPSKKSRTTMG